MCWQITTADLLCFNWFPVRFHSAEDKLQALEQPPIQTLSKTTTDRTPSRQRRSSGGERHYRTLHNSDYASSGGTSAKSGPSHLDYPDNRRKDLITVTGSNMPSSYVNSAYDGYIEGHPNPAVWAGISASLRNSSDWAIFIAHKCNVVLWRKFTYKMYKTIQVCLV